MITINLSMNNSLAEKLSIMCGWQSNDPTDMRHPCWCPGWSRWRPQVSLPVPGGPRCLYSHAPALSPSCYHTPPLPNSPHLVMNTETSWPRHSPSQEILISFVNISKESFETFPDVGENVLSGSDWSLTHIIIIDPEVDLIILVSLFIYIIIIIIWCR